MSTTDVYAPDLHATTRESLFYTLVMFPYPSGYGLHVGHASNFVINDVLARYKRLKGYTVFNPFGFDSFGLPTENYAMKLGKPAYEVTEDNIKYYSSQVAALDLSFDTERTVVTSRPDYYKRTQWIFQQLYKAGLVYRDTLRVNRCPECQTVLANDQVIEGTCERCKSEIIQKKHPQWFIKITAYAEKLLADLDLVDRPEETKIGQKNWIGKSEGAEINFCLGEKIITVFTTRPDTIYGVTALVLAPENTLLDDFLGDDSKTRVEEYRQTTLGKTAVQRQKDLKEKTGVFSGLSAVHPLTGEQVPVRYADYVLPDYGTGAVMMVPAHDVRDFEFAIKFSIPVKKVIARETGQKRDNEEFKDGGAAIVFDPKTQTYAVAQRPDGRVSLFAGGVAPGESIYEAILREVQEESGLYDFAHIEWIETSYAHYFNQAKQVNRVARAECLLIILGSSQTKEVTLEDHETFHLARKSPEEIKTKWLSANKEGHYDHYVRFLDESVARACALGYDTTSNKDLFVSTAMTEYGILEKSDQFTGLTSFEAKKKIAEHLESIGVGRTKISYKLRDRSVSRQRYRGSPIPVYYDENNTPHLIPEEELPVILPLDLENYKPTGKSPLEDHPTFPNYQQDADVIMKRGVNIVYTYNSPDMKLKESVSSIQTTTVSMIIKHPFEEKYLLCKHANTSRTIFPGGQIEKDESKEQAALREMKEETGYGDVKNITLIGENMSVDFYHPTKKVNFINFDNCVYIELNSLQQEEISLEEQMKHTLLWIEKDNIVESISGGGAHKFRRNRFLHLPTGDDIDYVDTLYIDSLSKEKITYRRECDTLDTFMCSSFYFLRYPDANNPDELCDPTLLNKCFPIDFYIGGKEHTVGHLLYARFIHKFLYDKGYVSSPEPFQRLVHQGMVLGADGRKMSKRWGNVIDPMEVIEKYGSDAVRTYLMFMGPVEQEKVWNDGALAGVAKFLTRVKNLVSFVHDGEKSIFVERALHKAVKGLTDDMEKLKYNTAVSKLMILLNSIEEHKIITKEQIGAFLLLLFAFAPQTSRQIWTDLGLSGVIDQQLWPLFDVKLTVDETISLPVQINGKVRVNLSVVPEIDEAEVLVLALQEDQVKKYVQENAIKKVIYVQGKILNIVI